MPWLRELCCLPLILLVVALTVSGCGGGGGGGGGPLAAPGELVGKWDTLVWDEGSWE